MPTVSYTIADLDTQLVQSIAMENRTITKTPYKEKNSVVISFMSRSAHVINNIVFSLLPSTCVPATSK